MGHAVLCRNDGFLYQTRHRRLQGPSDLPTCATIGVAKPGKYFSILSLILHHLIHYFL